MIWHTTTLHHVSGNWPPISTTQGWKPRLGFQQHHPLEIGPQFEPGTGGIEPPTFCLQAWAPTNYAKFGWPAHPYKSVCYIAAPARPPKSKLQNPKSKRAVWILDFGVWILDLGFWILDFGSWILDFGFWILDLGFWILDFGFWILDFGFWILDFGFWILDLGFWILDFGSWILDFGFWIVVVAILFVAAPNAAVWILDFGFWILDFAFWILDLGFWILDFGSWILDFGFWIFWTVWILHKIILLHADSGRRIEHTPAGEFLTCPVFGLKRYAMSVATSNHPVLDVMFLATCGHKPSHSFAATPKITCPACNGKHRKHTYDDHCNLEEPKEKKKEKIAPRKSVPLSKDIREPEISAPAPTHRLKSKSTTKSKPEQRLDDIKETELEIPDLDEPSADEPPAASTSSKPKKNPRSKQEIAEGVSEVPVSQKKDPKVRADFPLALKRIHQKLESFVEVLKLHLH